MQEKGSMNEIDCLTPFTCINLELGTFRDSYESLVRRCTLLPLNPC